MTKTDTENLVPGSQKTAELGDRPWRALPSEVAIALRPFVQSTADEMIAAIQQAVPAYSGPLEGSVGQAIRMGVERSLGEFLDEVEGKEPDPSAKDLYAALGRAELREGRDMEALLTAYRVGARVAWRRTAAAGRKVGFDADTLTLLAEAFFAYIDQLSARSAAGYAEEQAAMAGDAAPRRRSLVLLLTASPPAERTAVELAAREAGWQLPAQLAALVWRDASEQPVARRLPIGSLSAALDDGVVCALVPDVDAPGRRGEIESALGRRRAALGPSVGWAEAWRTAQRALDTHRLLERDLAGAAQLVVAEEQLDRLVLHRDPLLVNELAARRLAPLETRTPAARARLLETLGVWLDHQGHVPSTAEALHVHPQTVRYRMTQLRELFGDSLDDPRSRFELMLAVRAEASTALRRSAAPSG